MDRTGTRLRRRAALGLAAAALCGLLGAAPAGAQWFAGDEPIPARAVVMRLLRQGFSGVSQPRFERGAYTVDATNRWGNRVRLVIDAYDGDVLAQRRLEEVLRPPLDVGPRRFERAESFEDGLRPPIEVGPRRRLPSDPFEDGPRADRPPWSPDRSSRLGRIEGGPYPPEALLPRERTEPPREPKTARTEPARRAPSAAPAPRSSEAPTVPAAPAPAPEASPPPAITTLPPAEPAPPAAAQAAAPPPRRDEPVATGNASPPRSVRVIEGVTPVPSKPWATPPE